LALGLIRDLIKLAPDQKAMIEDMIAKHKTYNEIQLAVNKGMMLQLQLRWQLLDMQRVESQLERDRKIGRDVEIAMASSNINPRSPKYNIQKAALWNAAQAGEKSPVDALREKEISELEEKVKLLAVEIKYQEDSNKLVANKVVDEKKLKELEREAHARAELELLVDKAGLLALEKKTDFER